MAKHSEFSASGAYRWATCSGSLAMAELAPPQESGNAAMRGTAAHEVAAEYLEGPDDVPVNCEGREVEVEGRTIVIDEELEESVALYVNYVRSLPGRRLVEVESNYADSLGLDPDKAWGTADAVVLDGKTLRVIDLKTGRLWVGVVRNLQLTLYALGVLDALKAVGMADEVEEVIMTIYQPIVSEKPAEWSLTREEFEDEVQALREAAQRAAEATETFKGLGDRVWEDKYLRPSEEACRWCPAASFCPALKRATEVGEAKEYMLSTEQLNEAVERIPLLELWISAIRAEAHKQAAAGQEGLAFKLVLGRMGNRRWADESKALAKLSELIPRSELLKPAKLKSPAQVEKLMPKGWEPEAGLVVRNPAKPTMVPADDPRPQWVEDDVADEFEVLT